MSHVDNLISVPVNNTNGTDYILSQTQLDLNQSAELKQLYLKSFNDSFELRQKFISQESTSKIDEELLLFIEIEFQRIQDLLHKSHIRFNAYLKEGQAGDPNL